MVEKTEYEELLEKNLISPLTSLEAVFIGSYVEQVLEKKNLSGERFEPNEEDFEALRGCWIEIQHIFKDDKETIDKVRNLIFLPLK